jgi:D-amino-acid dehydrogenase
MRTVVVGAGLLGLTTAYFLRRHGAEVTVVDRQKGPGLETSFANGGMLHASQASPWNAPGVFWYALRMFGREDSALLIRLRALPRMLGWAWTFFRNATPATFYTSLEKNTRLADYSLSVLNEHYAALNMNFDRADHGTLKIYRTAEELDEAVKLSERCAEWGVRYSALTPAEITALEPALGPIESALTGGVHFPDDVSGDAHKFCRELKQCCDDDGISFMLESEVSEVLVSNAQMQAIVVSGETLRADNCVIAAGSYSTHLAATAGVKIPVQPVKGYSVTVPMSDWASQPAIPVIDDHYHAAVTPLGDRLRVAGTAEFAGFDDTLTPSRIENLYALIRHVYPRGADRIDRDKSAHWTGLRPMSPDGVGVMGDTPIRGLYLNTGHGHLGWTMAPGAGKLVADRIVTGHSEIDLGDYSLARY